jgi:hypothetical protein
MAIKKSFSNSAMAAPVSPSAKRVAANNALSKSREGKSAPDYASMSNSNNPGSPAGSVMNGAYKMVTHPGLKTGNLGKVPEKSKVAATKLPSMKGDNSKVANKEQYAVSRIGSVAAAKAHKGKGGK